MGDITVRPWRVTSTDHPDRDEYASQRSALRADPCLDCTALNMRRAHQPAPSACPRCGSTNLLRPTR